jgi:hypothetical protein
VQAGREHRAGKHASALRLVEQALRARPGLAEARRHRARLKALLGDLSGAVADVVWWRATYGDESADRLLDELRRLTRR